MREKYAPETHPTIGGVLVNKNAPIEPSLRTNAGAITVSGRSGDYLIEAPDVPDELFELIEKLHRSATCVVWLALDVRSDSVRVVVKFMRNKDQSDREVMEREGLDGAFVVGLVVVNADTQGETKLAEYNGVKGALQASERKAQGNLMVRNPNPNHP